MIGFTVIGGYLGAGKTTLLNHLLSNADGRRFGVLVNDFGAINIDAELIESRGDNTITLTNGCICCSLADGFVDAIDQLLGLATPPEHIVVEASGVAEVNQLAQYGYMPGLMLDGVLVVVDAETLLEKVNDRYVGKTIRRQIGIADLVVLNKIDLIDSASKIQCIDWLRLHYPEIRLISCERGQLPLAVLVGRKMASRTDDVALVEHAHHTSWSLELSTPVTREQLEGFVQGMDATVIRAKGTTGEPGGQGLQMQLVGRRVEIAPLQNVRTGTRLVAIGLEDQFDPHVLDQLAERWFGTAPAIAG